MTRTLKQIIEQAGYTVEEFTGVGTGRKLNPCVSYREDRSQTEISVAVIMASAKTKKELQLLGDAFLGMKKLVDNDFRDEANKSQDAYAVLYFPKISYEE